MNNLTVTMPMSDYEKLKSSAVDTSLVFQLLKKHNINIGQHKSEYFDPATGQKEVKIKEYIDGSTDDQDLANFIIELVKTMKKG